MIDDDQNKLQTLLRKQSNPLSHSKSVSNYSKKKSDQSQSMIQPQKQGNHQFKIDKEKDQIFRSSLLSIQSSRHSQDQLSNGSKKRIIMKQFNKKLPEFELKDNARKLESITKQSFQIGSPKEQTKFIKKTLTPSPKKESVDRNINQPGRYLEVEQIIEEQQKEEELDEQDENVQKVDEELQEQIKGHLMGQKDCIDHLTGNCLCMQCPCGHCKCEYAKVYHKNAFFWKSSYRNDFNEKEGIQENLKLNLNQFNQYKSVQPCDYTTTCQQDYKQFELTSQPRNEKQMYIPNNGQTPQSSYKNDYPNYGVQKFQLIKQSQQRTVVSDLPLLGRTSYESQYVAYNLDKDNKLMRPPPSKPYPTVDLFLGDSQNHRAYNKKQRYPNQKMNYKDSFFPIPSYAGQYNSLNKMDYTQHEQICRRQEIEQSRIKQQ